MRIQLGNGAPPPGNTTWQHLITEAETKLAKLAEGPGQLPKASTVGAQGAASVKTGSNSVKVSGSGGGSVAGSAVQTAGRAGTVGKAALLVGGSLCGGVIGARSLMAATFGDPWAKAPTDLDGVALLPSVESDWCGAVGWSPGGAASSSWCVQFATPMTVSNWAFERGHAATGMSLGGSATTDALTNVGVGGSYAVPCLTPENQCGLVPVGYRFPGTSTTQEFSEDEFGSGLRFGWSSPPWTGALARYNDDWGLDGFRRRLRGTTQCKHPDGRTSSVDNVSAPFWDSEDTPDWPDVTCPVGFAPTSVKLTRQTMVGGGAVAATWTAGQVALDWAATPSVVSNPTTLACFAVGAADCPMPEKPGDPTKKLVGGPGGVEVPANTPMTADVARDSLREANPPGEEPEDLPSLEDLLTPDPQNPGDGTPGTQQGPDPRSGGTPGTSSSGEGQACWPQGWGWLNPVEWVLKPIKCALVWAFWDQDAADEMSELGRETGWTEVVADSSLTTSASSGPCIDMDVAEICTEPILSVESPPWVALLLASVVLFFGLFEVVGLFARITGG